MPSDEVTQVRVGEHRVGIIGLAEVLAAAAEAGADLPEEELARLLLEHLEKRNYVPSSARDEYAAAMLREFYRFTGRAVDDGRPQGLEVKILGPGCPRCHQLTQDVMAVMGEMDLPGDVEQVTDVLEIGRYGVMGTPALVVNGEVKAVGAVPPRAKLKAWLAEAGRRP